MIRARAITVWPSLVAVMSTPTSPSCLDATLAFTSIVADPGSGTTTGRVNRALYSTTAPRSPSRSVTIRPATAMVNMPWAITLGRPTSRAKRSFQWMMLKSPDAPA